MSREEDTQSHFALVGPPTSLTEYDEQVGNEEVGKEAKDSDGYATKEEEISDDNDGS